MFIFIFGAVVRCSVFVVRHQPYMFIIMIELLHDSIHSVVICCSIGSMFFGTVCSFLLLGRGVIIYTESLIDESDLQENDRTASP